MIETVRGPVDPERLGRTLSHEHVFVLTPDSQLNWSDEWDEEERVADAIIQLRKVVEIGYRTFVDATVDGLGRNVPRIVRINAEVPELNIVVATGIYTWSDVPNFFAARPNRAMVAGFVRDLREGIRGTNGVKAAFIKCAVDEAGLRPGVERVLRNACAAHRETGAPLMVHTHPGTRNGLDVQRVVDEEGVPAGSVVLAHSGDATDPEYLTALADAGFFLGMDRFGLPSATETEARVRTVAEMCARGFAASMMLSHDAACYLDWVEPELRSPDWHFRHIDAGVIPMLLDAGVSAEDVQKMEVDAPRAWLSSRDV